MPAMSATTRPAIRRVRGLEESPDPGDPGGVRVSLKLR